MVSYSRKQQILFDLDGTLTDPAEGITNSVRYSLEQFGIFVTNRTALYPFIGPPLQESYEKFYGFSAADAKKAVDYYRVYFSDRGIYENRVYDGIAELLKFLCESGRLPVLATSKPTVFAERILAHFGLRSYFGTVVGSELNGERVHKSDVIACALERAKVRDRNTAVMIGDRGLDISGAHANGVEAVGVLYGYGNYEELQNAGADDMVGTVEQLRARFL